MRLPVTSISIPCLHTIPEAKRGKGYETSECCGLIPLRAGLTQSCRRGGSTLLAYGLQHHFRSVPLLPAGPLVAPLRA